MLFIDLWVNARSENKAQVLAGRVAARGQFAAEAFHVAGFDDTRELWKVTGVVDLPSSAAEGAWAALRIAGRLARSVSVSGPQILDGGQWSLEGHAAGADLIEPGSSFISFSARSSSLGAVEHFGDAPSMTAEIEPHGGAAEPGPRA